MPTLAQVNVPFGVLAHGLAPGEVGSITVEVYDPTDGRSIVAPTAAGVTEPRPGSYYTTLVVTVPGSYSVRWVPSSGLASEDSLLVTVSPVPVPGELRPTQEEVAALLYDRVVKEGGQPIDGFTDDTEPTVTEVERIITMVTNDLVSRPDVPIPPENVARGRWLATTYAAWLVVLIHAPEQTENSEGFDGLKDIFDTQVGAWVDQCQLPLVPYMG
jgi:hypothetical protein